MDNRNVIESNLLIAEFMGGYMNHYNQIILKGSFHPLQKLLYHSSWDWLMPVWKKFRETNYDYPNGIKRDDLKNEHEHFRELIIGSLEICSH